MKCQIVFTRNKMGKYFKMSSAEMFTQSAKRYCVSFWQLFVKHNEHTATLYIVTLTAIIYF